MTTAPRKTATKPPRSRAREFAVQALYQHLVGRQDPEAIDQFMQGASPAERQRFTQGVLARLQQEPKRAKLVFPSRALRTATDLTRMAHTPSQTWADFLSTLGLTSANAAGGPP